MLSPCNQISPTRSSGSSAPVSGSTIAAHWLRATCAARHLRDGVGCVGVDAHGPSGRQLLAVEVDGGGLGVRARSTTRTSVASAIPYDGWTAVLARPYGSERVGERHDRLEVHRFRAVDEPTTLLRSRSSLAAAGPAAAARSNAKFGAGETMWQLCDSSASSWIQRNGLRTNAIGDMKVRWPP